MQLVYVLRRFPKVSETFTLQEIQELRRQGERVTILSLARPFRGEPFHPGAGELAAEAIYVPEGRKRFFLLAGAALRAIASSPRRGGSALLWSLSWAVRDRSLDPLRRFGEASYLRARVPRATDHLHAQFAHSPASVALLLSRLTGRPFSFTGHAKDIFELVRPSLLRAKIAEARFVVAVCDYTRRFLAATGPPEDRAKVVVVRNGIDCGRFARRAAQPNGVPTVLAVSRLVEKKGLDTLVEACGELARRGVEFRCEIVGDGPGRSRLQELARRHAVGDRLHLPGHRDHEAVRATYHRAAVFALPCKRTLSGNQDALPVSLLEAMSVGVPVVTTPIAGIPEVVRHNESGLLVAPRDHRGLADALERVLSNRDLRGRLVTGGAQAAEGFRLADSVASLRRLFREGTDPG